MSFMVYRKHILPGYYFMKAIITIYFILLHSSVNDCVIKKQ